MSKESNREIQDGFMKFIEPALDNGFDDGYRGADTDKAQKAYRDRYAWALDIRDFIHQELQKAREEERERIAQWAKQQRKTQYVHDFTEEAVVYEDLMEAIYQSELDQDNSKTQ